MSHFFNIDLYDNFFLGLISICLSIIILLIGLISLNVFFTIIHSPEKNLFYYLKRKLNKKVIEKYLKGLLEVTSNNFKKETKKPELDHVFLWVLLAFYALSIFVKGNPYFYNYVGLFRQFDVEVSYGRGADGNANVEETVCIYQKNQKSKIEDKINYLEEKFPDSEIRKSKYLFIQAGIIDGYKTGAFSYTGIGSYLECLLLSLMEKLISLFFVFLIPFIIILYVTRFIEIKNENNERFANALDITWFVLIAIFFLLIAALIIFLIVMIIKSFL